MPSAQSRGSAAAGASEEQDEVCSESVRKNAGTWKQELLSVQESLLRWGCQKQGAKRSAQAPVVLQVCSLPIQHPGLDWQSLTGKQLARKEEGLQSPRGIKPRMEGWACG